MPWEPLPTGSDEGPQPVRAGLDRVVRHLGGASVRSIGGLFDRWPEIVGPRVAEHARPLALRDATLVLAVDDPAWATQLRFLEHEILEKVRAALDVGELTRVEVRVKPPS